MKVRDNESGVLIEAVRRKTESIPLREECGSEKPRQLPLLLLPLSTMVPLVQFSILLISDLLSYPGKRHTSSIASISICGLGTLAITISARVSELVNPQLNGRVSICSVLTLDP